MPEEVILHLRFRVHSRHAESPHGQQIGGNVFTWPAKLRCGGTFIDASWTLSALKWMQLPTQHMDIRSGRFFPV